MMLAVNGALVAGSPLIWSGVSRSCAGSCRPFVIIPGVALHMPWEAAGL
jgi:hypothetical protein